MDLLYSKLWDFVECCGLAVQPSISYDTIRYDTMHYIYLHLKADKASLICRMEPNKNSNEKN